MPKNKGFTVQCYLADTQVYGWVMVQEKSCDVLIIGGGLAGIQAALQASRMNANVIITSERRVGKSGNSVIAQGGYSAPFGHADPRDNPEVFYEDIVKSGEYLNDKDLANILAKDSCRGVDELRRAGVTFEMYGKKYAQKQYPGHSYPRNCCISKEGGINITLPLLDQLKRGRVNVLNHFHALRLFVVDHQCQGGLFISTTSGEMIVIGSKATILATGGGGSIFERSTNVKGSTGDGFALALEAGMALRDMEFIQFYPTIMMSPVDNLLIDFSPFGGDITLLNRKGEPFLEKHCPKAPESCTRDVKSQAIFREIMENRDVQGGVMLDISNLHPRELIENVPSFVRVFKVRNLDPFKETLIVAPAAHFFMGGVQIDEHCNTSMEGLFACGEVTGGIHGANRLADSALTECQVFGRIAGEETAKYSLTRTFGKCLSPIEAILAEQAKDSLVAVSPSKIMAAIKGIMWRHVGIVRDGKGLEKGIQELEKLRNEFGQRKEVSDRQDIYQVSKARNALTTALAVAKAALARRESRGSHYRKDFPTQDDRYLRPIGVEMDNCGNLSAF